MFHLGLYSYFLTQKLHLYLHFTKLNNPIMKNLLLLALPALLLFSCKKNADIVDGNNIDASNSTYKYIKKLGYRDNEIKDIGNEFLVNGSVGVFLYYNGDDHFYTKNPNEFFAPGLSGYRLDRTAFFAY